MTTIIIIGVIIFLWWSLVPAKTQQPTLDDMITDSDRSNRNYSNVYKAKLPGLNFYYVEKSPREATDVKVFSGTENECKNYVYIRNS